MTVQIYLQQCQQQVLHALQEKLPPVNREPRELNEAMNYAVLNGGKRLRSALIYATGEALGAKVSVLDVISAAIEMVHAFSLIHDDLPALDNDDLRRGKPTCHKMFGESTAILAGDALQSLAFEILASLPQEDLPAETKLEMIRILARTLGFFGMIGGETLDLAMVNHSASIPDLEHMYHLKTGRLLSASVLLGALAANCQDKNILYYLNRFSEFLGLAFQIHDDIIGLESDTKTLGKKQGADLELNKPIYPVIAGMENAKGRRKQIYQKAMESLDKIKEINTDNLRAIASYVIERNY